MFGKLFGKTSPTVGKLGKRGYKAALAHKWPHQAKLEQVLTAVRKRRKNFVGPPKPPPTWT